MEALSPKMTFTGLKSRYYQDFTLSGGSREDYSSLSFPIDRGHSLIHESSIFKASNSLHHSTSAFNFSYSADSGSPTSLIPLD